MNRARLEPFWAPLGWTFLFLALYQALYAQSAGADNASPPDSARQSSASEVLTLSAGELARPRPAQVVANLPLLFLHDRGAPGQPLAFSALGSSWREVGVMVDGLDLRDPVSGTADLTLVPTFWLAHLRLEPVRAHWRPPGSSVGATLQAGARRHEAPRALSHVGYENGDWGVRAVDVALGMRLSPRLDLLAGALLAGFDGFGPRQQYDAQRIRATAAVRLGSDWQARYSGLLTKAEAEQTPTPQDLALRKAILPVGKDQRLDHALAIARGNGTLELQALVAHTELRREFHDYPLRLRWVDEARSLTLAASASRAGRSLAGIAGASLQACGLASEQMGDHLDVEGRVRLGLRTQSHRSWHLSFVWDGVARQGAPFYLAPAVQATAELGSLWRLTLDVSREVFFPSFQERYGVFPARGDVHLRPWAVHRVVTAVTGRRPQATWYAAAFVRQSAGEVLPSLTESGDALAFAQSAVSHRLAGLAAAFSAQPLRRLQFRAWLSAQRPLCGDKRLPEVPDWFAALRGAYDVALFASDLDLKLSLSCKFLGLRYDAQYLQRLGAVAIPSVELEARIMHNANVWLCLDNLLGLDYQTVWGYPMPKQFFAWGINWSFVD